MFEKSALNKIFGGRDRVSAGEYYKAFGRFAIPKPEAKKLSKQMERQGLIGFDFRGRSGMFVTKKY